MAYDPNIKLVDLYKSSEWICKLEYKFVIDAQTSDTTGYDGSGTWQYVGPKFDYNNRPSDDKVGEVQLQWSIPPTISASATKVQL
tara:strand:+ start:1046 stop:1300 length:255 start_codon:yes stop_codon:yes gene_type:complete